MSEKRNKETMEVTPEEQKKLTSFAMGIWMGGVIMWGTVGYILLN
jgi:hypothetical protein